MVQVSSVLLKVAPAIALALSGCTSQSTQTTQEGGSALINPLFASSLATLPIVPAHKTVQDVLQSGVVIVVSKPSQQMHVLRNGHPWKSSPVSTGKPGKETPVGVFAILQKREEHFSNLYNNAPMPFMQRLTWDGIAIHAGAIPGYPASNGCVRVPLDFAGELFDVTGYLSTAVIIADQPIESANAAISVAQQTKAMLPIHPSLLWEQQPQVQASADEDKGTDLALTD